jgi:hypothetical protein
MPEIKRTLNTYIPYAGLEIAHAVWRLAQETGTRYVSDVVSDVDGEKSFTIGISGQNDFKIYTGKQLSNQEIFHSRTYKQIGLGTAVWPGHETNAVSDYESMRKALEENKEKLERILRLGEYR